VRPEHAAFIRACKFGGRAHGLAFAVDEGVQRETGGEQLVAAAQLVFEADAQQGFFAQGGDDRHDIVVERGPQNFTPTLEHRQAVALGLELAVGDALFLEQGGAADLKPRQVVRRDRRCPSCRSRRSGR
jgi:hypothetical protein